MGSFARPNGNSIKPVQLLQDMFTNNLWFNPFRIQRPGCRKVYMQTPVLPIGNCKADPKWHNLVEFLGLSAVGSRGFSPIYLQLLHWPVESVLWLSKQLHQYQRVLAKVPEEAAATQIGGKRGFIQLSGYWTNGQIQRCYSWERE